MTDVQCFEAFVLAHQDMVYATAVRLLSRRADAEDVAQTAFLKAWERFGDLRDNPAAGGWLKTVTTNLALNHLTRYRSLWRLFSEIAGADDSRSTPETFEAGLAADDDDGPEEQAVSADELAHLERALRGLPPHQRVPIVLFHFDQMSYDAIAARLAVSVGKIKTDIHRGRLALRAALGTSDGR